jgi:hypothetical protein
MVFEEGKMSDTKKVTSQELFISSLAQTDALAKLLEKGIITQQEVPREGRGRAGRRIKSY